MPVQNWPPTGAPAWPPPEMSTTWLSASDISSLMAALEIRVRGKPTEKFTTAVPTPSERTEFFNAARCDEGHQVTGRMLVNPSGTTRYPFAVCNNAAHRQLLVLWGPDYCMGSGSGLE